MRSASKQEISADPAQPLALERMAAAGLAALGWFGLSLEIYFRVSHAVSAHLSIAAALAGFFSFFTIETNILAAFILTLAAMQPRAAHMLSRPSAKSALVVYIIVVGVVYTVLLQNLWDPQGFRWLADRILHRAIPILYTLYWLCFVPKRRLRWIDPLVWLIYPILYFIYILARGAFFGVYPYPFFDVAKLGYAHVGVNALLLLAAILGLGLIVTAIDHALGDYQRRRRTQLGRAAEF